MGLFLPGWSAEDRIRAYGVFGNMPYYLAHVREEASLAENILELVLTRDGLLHEEARLLLDIDRLQRLWLVRKELPVTTRNPERSRQSFYRITDPYLRFWFRFVLPAQGRLADAAAVGWWWGRVREMREAGLRDIDRELDAVALDDEGEASGADSPSLAEAESPLAPRCQRAAPSPVRPRHIG